MKPFLDYTEAEQTAIVWAAAVSWGFPDGERRQHLRNAFNLVNPPVDIGDGGKTAIPAELAAKIRELAAWQNLERNGPLIIS